MDCWPLNEVIPAQQGSRIDGSSERIPLAACIVLNAPVVPTKTMASLASIAKLRIFADGGSNVMFNAHRDVLSVDSARELLPDVIIGDLDSIEPAVRQFFHHRGAKIIQIDDQDSTDLDKALSYVSDSSTLSTRQFITILGSIGSHEGRVDQFFAVINSMYRYRNSNLKLIQIGAECILLVLDAGRHTIAVPDSAVGRHCGVVPMFGKVDRVISTGLEWNLFEELGPLMFGSLVSTNNITRAPTVTIETSHPLLFTITFSH